MGFVELNRDLVSLDPEGGHDLERSYLTGLLSRGAHKWAELRSRLRVVVLGDASSGKSSEFREQARKIAEEEQGFACYLTIERLSAKGIARSLSINERERFDEWRRGAEPGWFFLDSVDEARINRHDVELALNEFAAELGAAYPRAHVLLSCRGNVWEGASDRELIERTLPIRILRASDGDAADADTELFRKRESAAARQKAKEENPPQTLELVALGRITSAQRIAMLTALEVTDTEAFETALYENGLDPLAQRPGDLLMLVAYWKQKEGFGSFTEMMEFGIAHRLKEESAGRQQTIMLDELSIRQGAQRLAAALTLGQQMELILPGADAGGGIDPYDVLKDWKRADVEGLLHRGIFVPSTFGRVRFFHRSAQEYLTARWFSGLAPGLGDSELLAIFLRDSFGLETVPPSLRAAAAWLAATHIPLREELLRRTPQVLMFEGDPAALSLEERKQLLRTFAEHERDGKVTDRHMDPRPLWMFASEDLATSILEAAAINPRANFRFTLLRLIEQGDIRGCRPLLVESVADPEAYGAVLAVRILRDQGDVAALKDVAAKLLATPSPLAADRTPPFAEALFPAALDIEQVLGLIERTTPAKRYEMEGYRGELLAIYERCATVADRDRFLGGLAALAATEPLGDWPAISTAFHQLIANAVPLARAVILRSDSDGITDNLLDFLKAVGRAGDDDGYHSGPALIHMVAARPRLNEALFWRDVAEAERTDDKPLTPHQVGNRGDSLWTFDIRQVDWLKTGLTRADQGERHLALSILGRIYHEDEAGLDALAAHVAVDADLAEALAELRQPRVPSERELQWFADDEKNKIRHAERETERQADLRAFRDRLQADPASLCDPERLAEWPGPADLLHLTHWLGARGQNGRNYDQSAQAWPELAPAFGQPVADAYKSGMQRLWRVTQPERPRYPKGQRTVKYTQILSTAGLALEASEKANWAVDLEPGEAERAIGHVCLDDQGVPQWLGALTRAHPTIVKPHIAAALHAEWRSKGDYAPFFSRILNDDLSAILEEEIIALVKGPPPASLSRYETAAQIFGRFTMSDANRAAMVGHWQRRHRRALAKNDWETASAYLRMMIASDPIVGGTALAELLDVEIEAKRGNRAFALLDSYFDWHRGSIVAPSKFSARLLGRLTEIAYRLAKGRRGDDGRARSDPRDALLNALIRMDGEEAVLAVRALGRTKPLRHLAHRMTELGNEVAERAADRGAWTPEMVRKFETAKLSPIQSGGDLFDLACRLLDDIQWQFEKSDMSDQAVVQSALNEAAIQEWLGAKLEAMGGGRFRAKREAQVANNKRPDLVLSGGSPVVEVAIEIKHDEKSWTLPDLRHALHHQLTEQYLLPASRREGILVISNHRDRKYWRDVEGGKRIYFRDLLVLLQREAAAIERNSSGFVRVAVKAIDAAPGRRVVAREKDGR